MTLSVQEISALLDTVLGKHTKADVVAIRAEVKGQWPETVSAKGKQLALTWCESPLAVREALELREHGDAKGGLVVLTPLKLTDLGEDVWARLAGYRIYQPEGWEIARQLFSAKEADARLASCSWMPQLLIDYASAGVYPAVANGFLDIESAWREVLRRALNIYEPRPDAVELLRWSMRPETSFSYQKFPVMARHHLADWLLASSGSVGRLILNCIESGNAHDALPLGLVCDVVFSREISGGSELGHAAIRLERYVGNLHITNEEGRAWSDAARVLAVNMPSADLRPFLDRADDILKDLRISEYAGLSHILPSGLDARLQAYAAALKTFLATPSIELIEMLEARAEAVEKHSLVKSQSARIDRVQMATRLARWLFTEAALSDGFESLAINHATDTAYVDWARFRLRGGDELSEVSLAFSSLRDVVRQKVEQRNQRFSSSLADWNRKSLPLSAGCIPLEHVLHELVAPLAAQAPILLLVADGLSCSIFRELFANPESMGWIEWISEEESAPYVGVAVLPTVTEISRTSLLSGRIVGGTSSNEKQAFSNHPSLLQHSRTNQPPVLFHKADLADATTLSTVVRDAVSSPSQRIVGVVYNAIDDQLDGSDQLHNRWTIDDLRLLAPLLREARQAGRVLVVTADHGHVLEDGTAQRGAGDGDRWRSAGAPPGDQELLFEGGRVLTPLGAKQVVCVWSESVRHGGKKNGYHGGVSAQEVIVPLSVFTPANIALSGWRPAPPVVPEWWAVAYRSVASPVPVNAPVATKPTAKKSQPSKAQGALFGDTEVVAPAPQITDGDWIASLLASQTYASQKRLAARVAPDDLHIKALLEALQSRGGKLAKAVVAQRLTMPEMRVSGFVMAARRVLNVDQQSVLTLDETTGVVELNKELLLRQFRIQG